MTEPELVSIILPTYNRAELLPRAVNSVLNQTYQAWELLIWDDGSSDDTEDVIATFKDPRVRAFTEPNHGMSYALNQALKQARGGLIAFLDDDDEWQADKLDRQVSFLRENPEVSLVFGNFRNINHGNNQQGFGFSQAAAGLRKLKTNELGYGWFIISDGFLDAISTENFIAFDSVLARKSLIERVGKFEETIKNGMDFEYWWRMGLIAETLAYSSDIVMTRHKYPGSLSGGSERSLLGTLRTLDACAAHSRKVNRPETCIFLQNRYRNAWQNMITARALQNDRKGMIAAFRQSLKYGFRPGSLRLLIEGFLKIGGRR